MAHSCAHSQGLCKGRNCFANTPWVLWRAITPSATGAVWELAAIDIRRVCASGSGERPRAASVVAINPHAASWAHMCMRACARSDIMAVAVMESFKACFMMQSSGRHYAVTHCSGCNSARCFCKVATDLCSSISLRCTSNQLAFACTLIASCYHPLGAAVEEASYNQKLIRLDLLLTARRLSSDVPSGLGDQRFSAF